MSYKEDLQYINTELRDILDTANDLPTGVSQLSGLPIEVFTEETMNAILKNAMAIDVGTIYKYRGVTTDAYTNGELYIISEEDV